MPTQLQLLKLVLAAYLGPEYNFGGQVILPLAHSAEHEELLEVIKLEGVCHSPEDVIMPRDMFLLQMCSGMDENDVGTCAELCGVQGEFAYIYKERCHDRYC